MSEPEMLCLHVDAQALDAIDFGDHPGSKLRGALYDILRRQSCAAEHSRHTYEQQQHCPVCRIMALENPHARRGKDVPRPLIIQPPICQGLLARGETFSFGIKLFGSAIDLFPSLVLALPEMAAYGLGTTRGRFKLDAVSAYHPLTGERQPLMCKDSSAVRRPTLKVTAQSIKQFTMSLRPDSISLHFYTPMCLNAAKHQLHEPEFAPLLARLLERYDSLCCEYTYDAAPSPYCDLLKAARQVTISYKNLQWVDAMSHSSRTNLNMSVSGFVGDVEYVGESDLSRFHEWLAWGQCFHVGKQVTKGNGYYRVIR